VPADGMPVDRKLNIAVTRARQQFFLVGNIPLLSLAPDYLQLVQYIGRLSDSDNK
jgi:superfamily I DNA and/or RNA helicase